MHSKKNALITRCINGEKTLASMDIKWQEAPRILLRRKRFCDTIELQEAKTESLKKYLGHLIESYKEKKTEGEHE